MVTTRGCPRTVDTQHHFCPSPHCAYYGWVGFGNVCANGHPSGGRWRQRQCVAFAERTLALAQCVIHPVTQVLAPDCAPLFLTDGFRAYLTALLTPYGQWGHPERRHTHGPAPQPRWMPLPHLLYAQVGK